MARYCVLAVFLLTTGIFAQTPAQAPPDAAAAPTLPVRRVVLYKTGVGYFEHLGNVRDRQNVSVRFTSAQLNDVLKSLTTIDLGRGQITGVSYNSIAPLEQRLGALRLPLNGDATTLSLLGSLRGARVEVTSPSGLATGRLLSVERRARMRGPDTFEVETFSIVTDTGDVRSFDLGPDVRVRIAERDLRQEIGRYLDVVGSTREQDVRTMTIATSGTGERQLFVSYVSEVPIWKSTYRLVFPATTGSPLLQGWAIVDNTIGEDWTNVELSLVAGAPQSFVQEISKPYYGRRPVVALPMAALLTPQTHPATLQSGSGMVIGRVTEASGGVLPGVSVILTNASGETRRAVTDSSGIYEFSAAPGVYSLRFELQGFSSRRVDGVVVSAAASSRQNATLTVGSMTETLSVTASTQVTGTGTGRGGAAFRADSLSGMAPPPPPPPPADPYGRLGAGQTVAAATELGDLFEYRIKEPVTLRKNQSALVPILNAEITAEKVALWNRNSGSGRPLRAVWLTNGTGLTLDGGSMTVIEGNAFAGEGLIEPLKPGERRLVSYAAALGVLVSAKAEDAPRRIVRVRARDGIIIQESEERATLAYLARSQEATPTNLIIEHRPRPGWKLADGQTPVESTADAHRFRVAIDPGKEAALVVREVRTGETRISVSDVDDAFFTQMVQAGISAAELQSAFKPILEKRSELADLERVLADLQAQQTVIVHDQERLRENMKALRGSSEEKQLLQRYTRQLNDQENKLDALRGEIAQITARRNAAREALSKLVANLSFELGGK